MFSPTEPMPLTDIIRAANTALNEGHVQEAEQWMELLILRAKAENLLKLEKMRARRNSGMR